MSLSVPVQPTEGPLDCCPRGDCCPDVERVEGGRAGQWAGGWAGQRLAVQVGHALRLSGGEEAAPPRPHLT
jgi:hypothetical protein